METHPAIRPVGFIVYKFLNSIFLGLSVGAVFVLYTPLSPSIFSAGGIGLALGTVLVATQYRRILVPKWFYRLSLLVEFTTLTGVVAVLVFPLDLRWRSLSTSAIKSPSHWEATSCVARRCSWYRSISCVSSTWQNKRVTSLGWQRRGPAYTGLAAFAGYEDRAAQVIALHWPLLVIETAVIAALLLAFDRDASSDAPQQPLAL